MPTKLKLCSAQGSRAGMHEIRARTVWRYADADFEAEKFLLPWLSKSSLNLFVQA